MIDIATLLILLALASVAISWAVPARLALDAVAVLTVVALATLAPLSLLWLLGVAILTPFALRLGEGSGHRNLAAALWSLVLLAMFVVARLPLGIEWIGGAYFTLRALHVVGDWWMERLAIPSIRAHLRYHLFLPVIVSGPIHRFETFERQAERRRWDARQFFSGMERALTGGFMAFVLGGTLMNKFGTMLANQTIAWWPFFQEWSASVTEWISLYFVFAGLTSIALGTSLMIGLKLEENFNRPWAARNLIDFWTRWHMSLTRWCQDYVFRPVTAVTRNVMAGLVTSMLAIGLWHEFSSYYLLWSVWQVIGVVITRLSQRRLPFAQVPRAVQAVLGPISVLGWLSLARPVIHFVLGANP